MDTAATVLVADDEGVWAESVTTFLRRHCHYQALPPVLTLDFLAGVLKLVQVDVVLLDLRFGAQNALDVLEQLTRDHRNTLFVIITAQSDPFLATITAKLGAHGFIQKPATLDEIHAAVEEALAGGTPRYLAGRKTQDPFAGTRCREGDWAPTRAKVAWLLRASFSQAHIREMLQISDKDMQYHVRMIKRLPRTGFEEPTLP